MLGESLTRILQTASARLVVVSCVKIEASSVGMMADPETLLGQVQISLLPGPFSQ